MPEKERSIPEKGLEPEYSLSGDSEDVSPRWALSGEAGRGGESPFVQESSLKSNLSIKPEDLINTIIPLRSSLTQVH